QHRLALPAPRIFRTTRQSPSPRSDPHSTNRATTLAASTETSTGSLTAAASPRSSPPRTAPPPDWHWASGPRATQPNEKEILHEHRAAKDPRRSPATVGLPCRQ